MFVVIRKETIDSIAWSVHNLSNMSFRLHQYLLLHSFIRTSPYSWIVPVSSVRSSKCHRVISLPFRDSWIGPPQFCLYLLMVLIRWMILYIVRNQSHAFIVNEENSFLNQFSCNAAPSLNVIAIIPKPERESLEAFTNHHIASES